MEVRPNVGRGHPSGRAGDRVALGDSVLILSLFALLMITYGFELFNVSLNADEAYWATLSRDTLFREAVAGGPCTNGSIQPRRCCPGPGLGRRPLGNDSGSLVDD